ncbi:hypothetical protein AHF37_01838 [Paragonimus kellicotti]|nr:hypothetical protein AHF37_01838 [Paragonimus kellicotti]
MLGLVKVAWRCVLLQMNSTLNVQAHVGCRLLNIQNKMVNVQIWDTVGQERYKSLPSRNFGSCNEQLFKRTDSPCAAESTN